MKPDVLFRLTTASALLLFVAACATDKPLISPHAPEKVQQTQGAIRMPSGVYLEGLRTIDNAARTKLYVQMEYIGEPGKDKLMFSPAVARSLDLTPRQMQRVLMDTLLASRRFDVLSMDNSVTAEMSNFQVTALVTDAYQKLEPTEGGRRVAISRVKLSLQIKNLYTGELVMQDRAIAVEGQSGLSSGDRTVLGPKDDPASPMAQQSLAADYKNALHRAFKEAAIRVGEIFRPVGKVVSADGDSLGLLGGIRQGFQGKDELVVFRVKTAPIAGKEEIVSTVPVAVVRCDGVGSNTSQCEIIRRHATLKPELGDYAILSDVSMGNARMD
ncbi:hypothetical protein [Pelomonas sp. KK5]|uniref:hypothetical protein n=1 Tax=Pelomonas sp. KK5 TaxID=1855730 RepID=UPI00097BFEDD|nr:hypothetical protein [Pelomonas sp. KK5]